MSESADELSLVQSDVWLHGPGESGAIRRTEPAGSRNSAPIPVNFEIQLTSRPLPHHSQQHVFAPKDVDPLSTTPPTNAGPKKRGRPKGSTVAKIIAPHHSTSTGTVRRSRRPTGRPPENRITPPTAISRDAAVHKRRGRPAFCTKSARQYYLESEIMVEYVPFNCLWEGCKAELQNLDTLRRHVKIVHGASRWNSEDEGEDGDEYEDARSSPFAAYSYSRSPSYGPGSLACRWGKCALSQESRDREWTEEDWDAHIENDHIVPYAWHMGDGPNNTIPSKGEDKPKKEELPEWLFGADGKQVTPDARNVGVEDAATAALRTARLRALRQSIWDKTPFEDDESGED